MRLDCGPCVVRTPRADDAEQLAAIANDWEVARYLRDSFPHPYTLDDAREWLARTSGDDTTNFAIEVDGRFAGGVGFVALSGEERHTAEIGYWLGRDFRGKGIATAACGAVGDLAFAGNDFIRLEARVHADNPASARVLEKCGYQCEGRLRNALVKGGKILDAWLYARIRS
jgi:ribosomal-protein-alanine N-acetyltransferase